MHVEHHPLSQDFSEDRDLMRELRMNDRHFAQLAEQYEELDKRICRVEDGIELLDDLSLNALKLERVALKDDIARQLRHASGTCCGKCSA